MSGPGNSQGPGSVPGGPMQLTPEQAQLIAQTMVPQLIAFAPHLTPEQALQLAGSMVLETAHLDAVVADVLDPARRLENPAWGFVLSSPNGSPGGKATGTIVVPKTFNDCRDLNEVMHYITVIATLTSPLSRAILRAFGYDYHYHQSRKLPERQKVIV